MDSEEIEAIDQEIAGMNEEQLLDLIDHIRARQATLSIEKEK